MRCFYSLCMIYPVYRTITSLSAPALRLWAGRRMKRGKEDPARLSERFGIASIQRPAGKLAWIHAASVGESLSVLPLLDVLLERMPEWRFLVTTGTVTSAGMMEQRLPPNVIHQFAPWDHPQWVARFMEHWRPDAVLWMESELWPNTLMRLKRERTPVVLVNARISPGSYRNWSRMRGFARQMLDCFSLILAGAQDYAHAYTDLGGRDVRYKGNLKMGANALPVDEAKLSDLKDRIGTRPCIGFMQTHPGEEIEAARLVAQWQKEHPDLLGIVVPRHPTRTGLIEKELAGYRLAVRSRGDAVDARTQIYLADTIGEMGLWYSLCPIAVIGGSFVPHGGQNPLEGTHFGTAIFYGPHMFNFPDITRELEQSGAAQQVADWRELDRRIRHYLARSQDLAALCETSRRMARGNDKVVDRFADEIIACIGGRQ